MIEVRRSAGILALLMLGAGCEGMIEPGGPSGPGGPGGPGSRPGALDYGPAPATRFARLTHEQWDRSVHDLLRLDDAAPTFGSSLRVDPHTAGFMFDNDATSLSVDEALVDGYRRSAEEAAAYVTGDAAALARILPAAGGDDATRAREFIRDFGLRAHRRPLDDADVDAYFEVYTAGTTLYTGVDPFTAGIRLVIESFLQAPRFVYRVEESEEASDGVVPLDSWEVASRLSFFLWNRMPDDPLFDEAAADRLRTTDQVVAQARRMLEDPRAAASLRRFHDQLLERDTKYPHIAPDTMRYPGVSPDLAEYAARESELFIQDVFDNGGGFRDMLLSTETFVNAELARIYGVPGTFSEDEFVRVSLDGSQRRGIFTQVGFLASNATSRYPDPIHRGVFLAKRITCAHIAAPPAMVPPVPPPPEGWTNRRTIEEHTQTRDPCRSCHRYVINPFGFPFESYDATGAWQTIDNGQPVETAAEPVVGADRVAVANGLELASALADSPSVHECYVQHWLEFAYGRPAVENDDKLIEELGAASGTGGLGLRDMLIGIVASENFLNRSTEELP